MELLVEADEIAYRAAFACQSIGYIFNNAKVERDLGHHLTKTDIKKVFKKRGKEIDIDYTLTSYLVLDEEYKVKRTIDSMIDKLHKLKIPGICDYVKNVKLYLSPSDGSNFRNSKAETPGPNGVGYKAGRPPKPYFLKFIRERLIKLHGAEEVWGYEADDALGIYTHDNAILVHIDKDINMIVGHHYNHTTGEYYRVDEGLGNLIYEKGKLTGRGLKWFYAQMLTGDRTDNIPGISRVGAKKAYDLLVDLTTESECFTVVKDCYNNQYDGLYMDVLMEIADLLWIVRSDRLTGRQYLTERGFI